MQTPQFDAPVVLWKLGTDHLGVARSMRQEGEWILGEAINHVISRPVEEQWRFEIVSENQAINHLMALRLSNTAIFRSWESN
jgi:hypothetical protein